MIEHGPRAKTHWTQAIKHTVPVRDSPVLPRSQLSHWGAGHLSCPITEDTAVKLSNKSVSEGGRAPPADRVTAWKLPRLQLGLRYPPSQTTEELGRWSKQTYGGWGKGWEGKKLPFQTNATFSGLNICGVINTNWIPSSLLSRWRWDISNSQCYSPLNAFVTAPPPPHQIIRQSSSLMLTGHLKSCFSHMLFLGLKKKKNEWEGNQ